MSKYSILKRFLFAGAGSALAGGAALAATPIDVILAVDSPLGGGGATVRSVNAPYTNSLGQVGFTGNLDLPDGSIEAFVWFNDGLTWRNSDAPSPNILTGNEATSGISDTGGFIYSPFHLFESEVGESTRDSVWTQNGLLLRRTDPTPGIAGQFATFNSRPRMTPDGTAWWIAGFREDTASSASQGRILYRADGADPSNIVPVISTMDTFDGFSPTNAGLGFAYDISENNNNVISTLTMAGLPTSQNSWLYLNGDIVIRQSDPVGDGTNWNALRTTSVNNSGDYLTSGTTSGGVTATQEYLAYNGDIAMRRGDTIDGVELLSNWAVRWASINNLGEAAYIWEGGSGASGSGTLFWASDAANMASTSFAILSIGDEVDTTGDGMPDHVLRNFNASAAIAPGIDFSDHLWVYLDVNLVPIGGGDFFGAIIRVAVPSPGAVALFGLAGLAATRRRRA
ncbi:MAG: PEP-CTERM sorting domain-containing protein [Phycisphaeraceae bacterium]|nr:MAG: PEP-CTERM sorting domain-containing protein [Phycisphaeraceae bacterium]